MRILVCDDEQRYCQIISEYILANFDENSEGVIETFNSAKELVYITNHPDYVFSCFETEPLNFLRKPIDKIEFNKTFQRIIKKYTEIHKCIPIKWQNDSVNLEIKDICYIEGYNRHLVFHLFNGESYEVVGKIDEMYNFLKVHGFVKSHQGFVVNMLHIKDFGESEIRMKNGASVLMSVRKRLKTKEAYSDYINRRF